MNASPIRVLVVDDSAVCREVLRDILETDRDITVIGDASSGPEALERIEALRPDLVTLDVRMPGMDGLEVVARLMSARPLPVLIVTDLPASPSDAIVFEALRRGALDVASKPAGTDARAARDLRARVRSLARIPVVLHPGMKAQRPLNTVPRRGAPEEPRVIGLGASAGGPAALATVLGTLPADFPVTIAIVQHLPSGFAESFARFLDARTPLRAIIAHEPVRLTPGTVVLPPDDRHLVALGRDRLAPADAPPAEGHRPSVDVLFRSLAEAHGAAAVGVLLTGIGRDGASGLEALRQRDAVTFAQDQASSTVFGMPRAAIERGAAERVLALSDIGPALLALVRSRTLDPARRGP